MVILITLFNKKGRKYKPLNVCLHLNRGKDTAAMVVSVGSERDHTAKAVHGQRLVIPRLNVNINKTKTTGVNALEYCNGRKRAATCRIIYILIMQQHTTGAAPVGGAIKIIIKKIIS